MNWRSFLAPQSAPFITDMKKSFFSRSLSVVVVFVDVVVVVLVVFVVIVVAVIVVASVTHRIIVNIIFRLRSINRRTTGLPGERIDGQTNLRVTECQIHAHTNSLLRENHGKDFCFTTTKKISTQIRFLGQTINLTFCFFLSRARLLSSAA